MPADQAEFEIDERDRPKHTGADRNEDQRSAAAPTAAERSAAEWEDRARRAAADLDNARKRHARELQQAADTGRADVAARWLPIIDNLDRAIAHAEHDPASILAGVRAVRDEAIAILARLGYDRHEETGEPFDPASHEVVAVVDEPDVEPGTVVQVLRPGYGEPQRQLRPASVAVSRSPE